MNDNWSTKYHYFVWAPLAWKTALHRVGKLRMSEFKLTCGFLWIKSDFSNIATSRSLELDEAWSSCWICLLNVPDMLIRIKVWWLRRPFHFFDSPCLIILVNKACFVYPGVIQGNGQHDWVKNLIPISDTCDLS